MILCAEKQKKKKCVLTTVHTSSITLTNPVVEMLMTNNTADCNFWFREERIMGFNPIIISYHLSIKIPVRMGLWMRLDKRSKYGVA